MPPGQDDARPVEPAAELGRLPAISRWALAAGALLLLAWVALHQVVDRAAIHDLVRARASALLAARLPGATLGPVVEIDWAFRVWLGPLRVPGSAPDGPLVLEVDRIRVRASLPGLLAGRAEPASIRLYGLRLRPGPNGRELLALLERLRAPRPAAAAGATSRGEDPVVHLRNAELIVSWRGKDVALGPYEGRIQRSSSGGLEVIEASLGLPGGGRMDGTLRRSTGGSPEPVRGTVKPPPPTRSWSARLHLSALPADLPAPLVQGDVRVETGALALDAELSGDDTGGRGSVRGRVDGLHLYGARLGSEQVGPLAGSGEVEVAFSRRDQRLSLSRGRLRLMGALRVELDLAATLEGDLPFTLSVKVPPVEYRALVDALPSALAPPDGAPRPPGTLSGAFELSGPLTQVGGWRITGDLDLSDMRAAAREAPPSPLLAPFQARPGGEDGPPLRMGPGNPDFVPLAELPASLVRAVTTAEDAGFFAHHGFDFPELLDAAAAGAQAGRVVRGASTISQQLAKNLYLSRDRTLARKTREALLTVALEASVGKARLLEIYLNLIEWGPGVYGVGPAARRYFATDARQLTPRQACFLAAVVPSPRRGWALVKSGQAAEALRQRIDELLLKLDGLGVIDDEVLQRELEAPLRFAFGATPTAALPVGGAEPMLGPDTDREPEDGAEHAGPADAEPLAIPPASEARPQP